MALVMFDATYKGVHEWWEHIIRFSKGEENHDLTCAMLCGASREGDNVVVLCPTCVEGWNMSGDVSLFDWIIKQRRIRQTQLWLWSWW